MGSGTEEFQGKIISIVGIANSMLLDHVNVLNCLADAQRRIRELLNEKGTLEGQLASSKLEAKIQKETLETNVKALEKKLADFKKKILDIE
jgi:septal ring factor EnvC (AmiA/AmiB activator)